MMLLFAGIIITVAFVGCMSVAFNAGWDAAWAARDTLDRLADWRQNEVETEAPIDHNT